jgi:formylglycine-generating enzyme required for sulfatase activity
VLLALCWPLVAADAPSDADVDLTFDAARKGFTNSLGMRFVPVKAGTFVMGSPKDEKMRDEYEQQHEVEISRDFYLGVHEVSQRQYKQVMGYNPSFFSTNGKHAPKGDYTSTQPGEGKDLVKGLDTSDFPVENVSWQDAHEFLTRLNALAAERKFRGTYCLPTEAQWEYACRGGHKIKDSKKAQFPFHFNSPSGALGFGQANFASECPYEGGKKGKSLRRTNTVGKNGEPNALGLHDMHGNVGEFCSDWYDPRYYANSRRRDPTGPERGTHRVHRGGCWGSRGEYCRAADRSCSEPSRRHHAVGIRVAAVPWR